MILMLGLLESMLSKPNINIIILFQKKSIHTLENKVLMHQCAISAKDIKINSLSHPSPKGNQRSLFVDSSKFD